MSKAPLTLAFVSITKASPKHVLEFQVLDCLVPADIEQIPAWLHPAAAVPTCLLEGSWAASMDGLAGPGVHKPRQSI